MTRTSSAASLAHLSDAKRKVLERRLQMGAAGHASPGAANGRGDAHGRTSGVLAGVVPLVVPGHDAQGDGSTLVRLARPLGPVRASFTQARYFRLTRESPAVTQHAQILHMVGVLDPARLRDALGEVFARHEILRTAFLMSEEGPLQVVLPPAPLVLDAETPPGATRAERWEWLRRLARTSQAEMLDMERSAPIRLRLFHLDECDHALLWTANHIMYDDWSSRILMEDLRAAYRGEAVADPAVQHADYSEWWRRRLIGPHAAQLRSYWNAALEGSPGRVEIPYDLSSSAWPFPAGQAGLELPPQTVATIQRLAAAERSTLFAVVLTVAMSALRRWTGQRDLLVGTSYADRGHPSTARVMGPLINWLPIRVRFGEGDDAGTERRRVRQAVFGAIEHHLCPMDEMGLPVDPARPQGDGLQPYNVKFTVRRRSKGFPLGPGLGCQVEGVGDSTTRYDLQFLLDVPRDPGRTGVRLRCVYNAGGISAGSIQDLLGAVSEELQGLEATP